MSRSPDLRHFFVGSEKKAANEPQTGPRAGLKKIGRDGTERNNSCSRSLLRTLTTLSVHFDCGDSNRAQDNFRSQYALIMVSPTSTRVDAHVVHWRANQKMSLTQELPGLRHPLNERLR